MSLDRAIAALRAGRPVRLGELTLLGVETATAAMLQTLDPEGGADLLISGQRAAALGLANEREASDAAAPVRVSRPAWMDRAEALALVDPAQDMNRAPMGPVSPVAAPSDAEPALKLARLAGLLPALWLVEGEAAVVLDAADLEAEPKAIKVAQAALPLSDLPDPQILVFRDSATGEEHVALILGSFAGAPPLVRLHSECLTGDVFGSLKCDCGPQLRAALDLIAASGGGVLLYLRQEGRGIGLANKIRAYGLQDRGLDTVDANRRLGFVDDARDYRMAAAILRAMGISEVRLLTNNPAKVEGLQSEGIAVAERVAHHMPTNPHNADYIATKKSRSGHLD